MAAMLVALSLGSGGARGYAHIGVINELRERGHQIVGIAGSSMGALVGGLEAAGKLDEYAVSASSLTQGAVLRLLDPSLTSAGVLRAEKILDAVREILNADLTIAVSLGGDDTPSPRFTTRTGTRAHIRATEPDVAQYNGSARYGDGADAARHPGGQDGAQPVRQ
jgi:predicted acylesterase/phospholipase RssA